MLTFKLANHSHTEHDKNYITGTDRTVYWWCLRVLIEINRGSKFTSRPNTHTLCFIVTKKKSIFYSTKNYDGGGKYYNWCMTKHCVLCQSPMCAFLFHIECSVLLSPKIMLSFDRFRNWKVALERDCGLQKHACSKVHLQTLAACTEFWQQHYFVTI